MSTDPFEFPPELFSKVPLFAEIAKAMSWTGGPVNWDLARQIATAMGQAEHAAPVIDADRDEVREASRLADAWLREATSLPEASTSLRPLVLSPASWIDRALGLYPELIDPLGTKLVGALSGEHAAEGPLGAMFAQIMPLFLGIQTGSILGGLGRSVFTGYDVPFPLEEEGVVAVVLPHVDAHAHEYDLDRRETRYWATLHASAHRLAYEALPWTRANFFSLYLEYLSTIDVNLADMIGRIQGLDISNPEQMQSVIGEGLFGFDPDLIGPGAERLHRFLALMEASTDLAVSAASTGRLVHADRITETVARRRAAGGERGLEHFTGLAVPADVERAARPFCEHVVARGGWPLMNSLWDDLERLPTAAELHDPGAWIARAG